MSLIDAVTDTAIYESFDSDDYGNSWPEPPELVIQVDIGEFPGSPDHITARSGGTAWTVREYGETLIDFVNQTDLQASFEFDNEVKRLAEFNVSGATELAYFRIRVTDWRGLRSRVLFAPVKWVRSFLSTRPELAGWDIIPDREAAERGLLIWILVPNGEPMITVDGSVADPESAAERRLSLPTPDQCRSEPDNSDGEIKRI